MPDLLIQTPIVEELNRELLTGTLATRFAYLKSHLCPCHTSRGGPDPRCPVCHGRGNTFDDVPTVNLSKTLVRGGYDNLTGQVAAERLDAPPTAITSITDESDNAYQSSSYNLDGDTLTWLDGQPQPALYALYTVAYSASLICRGGIVGVKTMRKFIDRGVVDDGDLVMSVSQMLTPDTANPAYDAAEGDVFRLTDDHRREQQPVMRGTGYDALKYRNAASVRLSSVISGTIHVWQEGTDYTVTDGDITWLTAGPEAGTYYAAEYQANPEYHVFAELPQLRHIDGADNPRRFQLKLAEHAPNRRPT